MVRREHQNRKSQLPNKSSFEGIIAKSRAESELWLVGYKVSLVRLITPPHSNKVGIPCVGVINVENANIQPTDPDNHQFPKSFYAIGKCGGEDCEMEFTSINGLQKPPKATAWTAYWTKDRIRLIF